ncbi:outer membrane beta-barrel protein [Christiangramia aquimixticola]|uniref:outer membrane beta-barrel protein n=1 Tax=Christiangramia aquimixticola TaxID=1697558 RepID=UPI003AA8E803
MGFEVGAYHFKKFNVQLDISSNEIHDMSQQRSPEFVNQTVFLRYLVEAETALLSYRRNNIERFFYKTTGEEVQPLIFKNYLVNGKVGVNNRFKQQLSNNFKCGGNESRIPLTDYKEKDLVSFFAKYNECKGNDFDVKLSSKSSGKLNFVPKLGVGFGSMEVDNSYVAAGTQLSGMDFRVGAALEYNFSYNKNKWSALLEPMYRSFSDEIFVDREFDADLKVQYNSINVFTGIRYYMYLNEQSRIFTNLGVNLDMLVSSKIEFANTNRNMDPVLESLDFGMGLGLGAGYSWDNKLDFEVRFLTNRVNGDQSVDKNYDLDWKSTYQSINFIVGYKLF